MKLFETTEQMGHEQVLFCRDEESDLKAIIAIHDTSLGPAMGATRLLPYAEEEAALQDVLRLSRGMTYKAACANIPAGGGKAVIIAEPTNKTEQLFRAYGRFVESLKGHFITGQDVNLAHQNICQINRETNYVVGVNAGCSASTTALGVLLGIKAAVEFRLQKPRLEGLKVAVQGAGNVGKNVCKLLYEQGAELFVSDISQKKTQEIKRFYGATVVPQDQIHSLDVDVFSPCALGGILNSSTIPHIQAPVIAGAANNQLEDEQIHSRLLESRGILYCPDYVINAGGIIDVYHDMIGYEREKVLENTNQICDTLISIFRRAQKKQTTTHDAANNLAKERIMKAHKTKVKA